MRLGVGATVVGGQMVPGDVEVVDGVVAAVGRAGGRPGLLAVPGFVDLQVNGFAGVDFLGASEADFRTVGEALLATGVTAFQPTFICAPEAELVELLHGLPEPDAPQLVGAHLEGPFLSPRRLGAHPPAHRRDPDEALLERLLDAGRVTEMTLAPELPGAAALVRRLLARGVVVSAGHTDATAAEAHAAFDLGVATVTHLFNAMRPFVPRDPGVIGAALTRPDVAVQIICDGHHLADETVRLVWAAAAGRVALVTDATAAASAARGTYRLGDVEIAAAEVPPRRRDGVLAGTALTMIDALRNLHGLGVPLVDAVGAATAVPARIARRPDLGTLREGGRADVVVLDDRLEIVRVVSAGEALVLA